MGSVVLLKGMLQGMGREAACDLLVWKASASAAAALVRVQVLDAPSDLPDGSYSLTVEGRIFQAARARSQWMVQLA